MAAFTICGMSNSRGSWQSSGEAEKGSVCVGGETHDREPTVSSFFFLFLSLVRASPFKLSALFALLLSHPRPFLIHLFPPVTENLSPVPLSYTLLPAAVTDNEGEVNCA